MDQRLTTEKLLKEGVCRYSLITGISKRARDIAQKNEEFDIQSDEKPVITAAREYADGKFDIIPMEAEEN